MTTFDALASVYDDWYRTAVGKAIDAIERRAIDQLLPRAVNNEQLLEIGPGSGHWTQVFADYGYRVIGLELSPKMIAMAQAKALNNTCFARGDAQQLAFKNDSFEVVAAITTLEFVGNYQQVLQEMYRCLKPGGWMILGMLNKYSYFGLKRSWTTRQTVFKQAHFFSVTELKKLLAAWGKVRIIGCCFFPPYRWALPAAEFFELLGRKGLLPGANFLALRLQKGRVPQQ